jgi:hypothetical protein
MRGSFSFGDYLSGPEAMPEPHLSSIGAGEKSALTHIVCPLT